MPCLGGQGHAALAAGEEAAAQIRLQVLDAAADGGLGEKERVGSAGDILVAAYEVKDLVGVKAGGQGDLLLSTGRLFLPIYADPRENTSAF